MVNLNKPCGVQSVDKNIKKFSFCIVTAYVKLAVMLIRRSYSAFPKVETCSKQSKLVNIKLYGLCCLCITTGCNQLRHNKLMMSYLCHISLLFHSPFIELSVFFYLFNAY